MSSVWDYKAPSYNQGAYQYPDWAIQMGFGIAFTSLVPIPLYAIVAIAQAKGKGICEVRTIEPCMHACIIGEQSEPNILVLLFFHLVCQTLAYCN